MARLLQFCVISCIITGLIYPGVSPLTRYTNRTGDGCPVKTSGFRYGKGEILIKKTAAIAALLSLVLGFFMGSVCPQELLPWGTERSEVGVEPAKSAMILTEPLPVVSQEEPAADQSVQKPSVSARKEDNFNPKENFPLLNTACSVLRVIQERDYKELSTYVDGEQGLTLTTFSTVDREIDLTFTAAQVAGFAKDTAKYNWGVVPGSGEALTMTPEEYFSAYVFNVDYTQANRIGVDKINISGNALENVTQAYPGCRFVEFTFPGAVTEGQGQNWCSLKLVFAPGQTKWCLVGLIHSQWTA